MKTELTVEKPGTTSETLNKEFENEARIRVQISADMSKKHIDQAIEAFEKVGKRFKII